MASVISLGVHEPTALQYAKEEELLAQNASSNDYSWDIIVNHESGGPGEDELLVTKDCVFWSRGNIFRKCFGFKLEKEPVTQALLTYFPSSEHQSGDADPTCRAQDGSSSHNPTLSKALVVFLKTQAHIYFLDGTSHVVHMPFEVESACPAPRGVIIQRKQGSDNNLGPQITFPRVPPNSFFSPQASPVSMRSSQRSTFTTETLGRPKALPLRLQSSLGTEWDGAGCQNDSHWPRLISLTDPLHDMGLVVAEPDTSTKRKGRPGSRQPPHFLDRAEEIIHIEQLPRLGPLDKTRDADKLVLAVTLNRETSMYTVWKFTYLPVQDPFRAPKQTSSQAGRRRSSMQPGMRSGVASPLQENARESFGVTLPGKRPRRSDAPEKHDKVVTKLESTLGLDQDSAAGRRTSRRISSMLARADLSASQDRAAFVDPAQHPNPKARRDTSHGSSRARHSGAFAGTSFGVAANQTVKFPSTILDAPVDNLLDELRAGGDFEGFHSMGLDDHDFDGFAQEVLFTKIHSVPIDNSNVRYSLSKQPAKTQCKVFFLPGPYSVENGYYKRPILIGIQDTMEKRLQLLNLHLRSLSKTLTRASEVAVTFGQLQKAQNVIDSCKLVEGDISTILVLSESADGQRRLSMQAPWSLLTNITLPPKISLINVRGLDYRGSLVNRGIGLRRSIAATVSEIAGIRYPKLNGVVDIRDHDSHELHQIRIKLLASSPQVSRILNTLRTIAPPAGEMILAGWWQAVAWLKQVDAQVADLEWSALTIQLLSLYIALGADAMAKSFNPNSHGRTRNFLRSSSGAQVNMGDWDQMNLFEVPNSSSHPLWASQRAWQWMLEEDDSTMGLFHPSPGRDGDLSFMSLHVRLARLYFDSPDIETGYLPTTETESRETRFQRARDIFLALHLLLEEQKLDITKPPTLSPSSVDVAAVLLQVAKWMDWDEWVLLYELEMSMDYTDHQRADTDINLAMKPPPPNIWSTFDWIQGHLTGVVSTATMLPPIFGTLAEEILPRTSMFNRLFTSLSWTEKSPVSFVEIMHENGFSLEILDSLPEAVLVPLQDALAQCQSQPPATWSKQLVGLVDRSDVSSVLQPTDGNHSRSTDIITPTHLASWDFSSLCQNVMDFNDSPADDVAESDKQTIINAIFKEDRRLEEIRLMLTTTRARTVRLDPQPDWTESFYLEQQKETVARLATNTLSIPSGRGLMNYGLRFPLLTQKIHISGFVLNCTVKPTNVMVGVDKSVFTEEKIAWAFFHSGVAGGLAVSRQSKGIDTSWILYNKPGNDLNNRHAGFLLALGLNGHLKGIAKWVAFKYLTPKHTMTSIGLLLGLAASYIGTMDSLITRLLSVHVTRMLPRGAAELNLSPLTQTTGIMGIGLLYFNSQHRRMSEIMMSEIKHVETEDDEEPLRSECYRLAAGFALGFINLGKGKDLRGLHDMRITERLLTLATSTKRVDLVHILDRSSAAAVVAIALIYMKSEDQVVARKVDVPESILQFDYIRPDILLLRTVAKHLILWSEITPTHDWIRKNLPSRHQSRVNPPIQPFDHPTNGPLDSTHLPFLSILAGICWVIGLRFAGSGDTRVRDLLLNYLHRFYEQCRANSEPNFDNRLVQVTACMCLDVLSLATATVMAGTCDLKVLRMLRSLHGRNDPETFYGSHMASHMAIGVLSLGCGTQTFSTSNLAIGSLLVAFYPVFPDQVQDNKSHLQAFRHFWVFATDSRCLVTKDMSTNTPVSVPITIKFKGGQQQHSEEVRSTPCLLPPIDDLASINTNSPEFWNVDLNFGGPDGANFRERFAKNQVLNLRRCPPAGSPFSATMLALGRRGAGADQTVSAAQPLEWLFEAVPSLKHLTHSERGIVLDSWLGGPDVGQSRGSVVDARLVLEEGLRSGRRGDLLGLKTLFVWFEWKVKAAEEGSRVGGARAGENQVARPQSWRGEGGWLKASVMEELKGMIWLAGRGRE